MARTELTVTTLTIAGITPSLTPGQADGHFFDNPPALTPYGGRFAMVENTGAAPRNITFQTGATVESQAVEEVVIAVAAGVTILVGPFTPKLFNRPAGGADPATVYVDYDGAAPTELSIQIFEFPVT